MWARGEQQTVEQGMRGAVTKRMLLLSVKHSTEEV